MSVLDLLQVKSIPEEDEALRPEVRSFLASALRGLPVRDRAQSFTGYDADFSRALAARGWVGITLPMEYGGGGRSPFARYVIAEELLNAGAPVAAHWAADRQSGPLINRYGTERQKRFYLPRICRGEAFFCIGMSESQAGSDLAAVRSRATRVASGYTIKGQKIWTSNAHRAHYMIALVRTSGEIGDRQGGLSQMIIDMSLPGISVRPIRDLLGEAHFCEVRFDDVHVDADALVGEEGGGWNQVTAELALERGGPDRIYSSVVLFDEWIRFLRSAGNVDVASERAAGKIISHMAPLRAMSIAIQDKIAEGRSPILEAALVKDMGTWLEQTTPIAISDQLHANRELNVPNSLGDLVSLVEGAAHSFSLRGGTRDVLRGMIARGLGLR